LYRPNRSNGLGSSEKTCGVVLQTVRILYRQCPDGTTGSTRMDDGRTVSPPPISFLFLGRIRHFQVLHTFSASFLAARASASRVGSQRIVVSASSAVTVYGSMFEAGRRSSRYPVGQQGIVFSSKMQITKLRHIGASRLPV
jgi:hypothetical protein